MLPKMHKKRWVPMHFDEKYLMMDDLHHCQNLHVEYKYKQKLGIKLNNLIFDNGLLNLLIQTIPFTSFNEIK
jgi:hypothetical protein